MPPKNVTKTGKVLPMSWVVLVSGDRTAQSALQFQGKVRRMSLFLWVVQGGKGGGSRKRKRDGETGFRS